jgi:hypothetical protein
MGSRTLNSKQFLAVMQVSDVVKLPNLLEGVKGEENLSDFLDAPVRHNLSDRSLKLRPPVPHQ